MHFKLYSLTLLKKPIFLTSNMPNVTSQRLKQIVSKQCANAAWLQERSLLQELVVPFELSREIPI